MSDVPLGLTATSCFVATCRTCQESYPHDDEPGVIHFADLEAALTALRGSKWQVTDEGVQCRHCAADEACERDGHDWSGWLPSPGLVLTEYRTCRSCDVFEKRATP